MSDLYHEAVTHDFFRALLPDADVELLTTDKIFMRMGIESTVLVVFRGEVLHKEFKLDDIGGE